MRVALALLLGIRGVTAADDPVIKRLEPVRSRVGEKVAVIGRGFGRDDPSGFGKVWIGRCKSNPDAPGTAGTMMLPRSSLLSWTDTRIELILPKRSAGVVSVTAMNGRRSEAFEFEVVDACKGKDPGKKAVVKAVR